MTVSPDLVNQMVVVQNRCQKWKESDEISKNVNFEATDIYVRDFTVILMLKNLQRIIIYMENSCWIARFFHLLDNSLCATQKSVLETETTQIGREFPEYPGISNMHDTRNCRGEFGIGKRGLTGHTCAQVDKKQIKFFYLFNKGFVALIKHCRNIVSTI